MYPKYVLFNFENRSTGTGVSGRLRHICMAAQSSSDSDVIDHLNTSRLPVIGTES